MAYVAYANNPAINDTVELRVGYLRKVIDLLTEQNANDEVIQLFRDNLELFESEQPVRSL